jgi:hypothetical protein
MNENHAQLCASREWAECVQTEFLPPLVRDVDLGTDLLEIGPGPGAATEWLCQHVTRLTALESDGVSFTMLHHVPTVALQNQVLAEVLRVLRPGGVLIGSDSLASNDLHHFHVDDTYNPVEPASLLTRLQTLGFCKITVMVDWSLNFIAHRPASDGDLS